MENIMGEITLEDLAAFFPPKALAAFRQKFGTGWKPAQTPAEIARLKVRDLNAVPGSLTGCDCPACLNRGTIAKIRESGPYVGEVYHEECRCMAKRRTMKRLRESGLAELLDRYTLDTWEAAEDWQVDAKRRADAYLAQPEPCGWIYIGGRPGTGKTHLCTALCGALIERGFECRYMLWRDEATRLKARVNDEPLYQELIRPLKTAPLLYIDDLFKTGRKKDPFTGRQMEAAPTEGDLNLAFEILNARYIREKLITVISTELSLKQIGDMDEAIASRIAERARGMIFNWTERQNRRLK